MFASSKDRLEEFRDDISYDDFDIHNIKGDIMVMMIHCVFWTVVLFLLEGAGLLKLLRSIKCFKGSVKPLNEVNSDEDVVEEENRINAYMN